MPVFFSLILALIFCTQPWATVYTQGTRAVHPAACESETIEGIFGYSAVCVSEESGVFVYEIPKDSHLYLRLNLFRKTGQKDGVILIFYPGTQNGGEQAVAIVETVRITESRWQTLDVPLPGFDRYSSKPVISWSYAEQSSNLANRLARFSEPDTSGEPKNAYLKDYKNLFVSKISLISKPEPEQWNEEKLLKQVREFALTSGEVLHFIASFSPYILAVLNLLILGFALKKFAYQSLLLISIPVLISICLFLYPIAEWTQEIDKIRLRQILLNLEQETMGLNQVKDDALRKIEAEVSGQFFEILQHVPQFQDDSTLSREVRDLQKIYAELEQIQLSEENSKDQIRKFVALKNPLVTKIGEIENKYGLAFRITNGYEFYHSTIFGEGLHYKLGFVYVFQQVLHLRLKQDPSWKSHVESIRKFVQDEGSDLGYIDTYINQPERFLISGASEQDGGFRYHYLWTYKEVGKHRWIASVTLRPHRLLAELAQLVQKKSADILGFSGSMASSDFTLQNRTVPIYTQIMDACKFYQDSAYLVFRDNQGGIWPVFSRQLDWFEEMRAIACINLIDEFNRILIQDALSVFVLLLLGLSIVLLGIYSSRRIAQFLNTIVYSANQIRAGNYSYRLEELQSGDYASVSEQWNRLSQSLQEKQNLMEFLSASSHQRIVSQKNLSQRQFVSVLFAAHPEGEEALIAVLDSLHEQIDTRNGWVDKFTGTAVLAVFEGENCAHRASHCSIHIAKSLGIAAGVSSGELVLGQVGSSLRKDYTVIGDVVNTAARLESWIVKSGNGACIDSQTYCRIQDASLSGLFTPHNLKLKGKREELKAYAWKDQ